MRTRRPTAEHQEAVSRRLALLSAELATVRREPEPVVASAGEQAPPGPAAWLEGHTRIRAAGPAGSRPPDPAPDPDPDPGPPPAGLAPLVPRPGRHASRRPGPGLAKVLPDSVRGRIALGPAQVTIVAVLVALGLAATCWWVVRADSSEMAAPVVDTPAAGLVSTLAPTPGAGDQTVADSDADDGTVTVDVAGKVRRPGIAVLDAGSRVVDALEAAGGARPGVDLSGLNLARVLVDGEQILVGAPAPVGLAASAVPAPGAPPGPLVNLNTASQVELEGLPDVGPVTAQAIIAWRDEHGGFSAVEELLEVDGIGDATLGKLAPYVTV